MEGPHLQQMSKKKRSLSLCFGSICRRSRSHRPYRRPPHFITPTYSTQNKKQHGQGYPPKRHYNLCLPSTVSLLGAQRKTLVLQTSRSMGARNNPWKKKKVIIIIWYWMLGTVIKTWHVLLYLILTMTCEVGILIPILLMRFQGVKSLAPCLCY